MADAKDAAGHRVGPAVAGDTGGMISELASARTARAADSKFRGTCQGCTRRHAAGDHIRARS